MIDRECLKNILFRIRYYGKRLIECYTFSDLKKIDFVYLYKPVKTRKLKNLSRLNKDIEINFEYEEYDNIFKCINFLLENKFKNIIIKVKDRRSFYNYLINNNMDYDFLNIVKIKIDFKTITMIDFKNIIEKEKVLYTMIKPAVNLTPLEKFIYAYNITKNFKEYKENDNDKSSARDLYKILDNEYIVCVGYAKLLKNLLDKLDIKSTTLSIDIDESYDKVGIYEANFKEVKSTERTGHMRLYIYLKDDEYNIDGFYMSDPTWDNDYKHDYYNYALFTDRKNDYTKRYCWLDESLLFNVNTMYEFNRNFDILRNKLDLNGIYLINYILEIINELDPDYMKYLKDKYILNGKHIIVSESIKNYTKIIKLKNELGTYIISKVNKEIDYKKIERAIRKIYIKSYGFKDKKYLNNYLEKVIKYNKKADEYEFPDRYKIDKEGNKKLIKKLY